MPAYNLLVKKEVYVKLVEIAMEKGISLGKLINIVLEEFVEKYSKNTAEQ